MRFFRFALIITVILQVSCTMLADLNAAAGEVGVQSKTKVTRQNYFTISPHSNVAVRITPYANAELDSTIHSRLERQSEQAFNYSFTSVTMLKEGKNVSYRNDYLVEAKIMALTNKPAEDPEQANPIFRTTIKVVLSDARTKQQLDIAVIKSRSGLIKPYNFDLFLKEAMLAYTYSLSATSKYTRY